MKRKLHIFQLLLVISTSVLSQRIVIEDNYTPQQLIEEVLINGCVDVSNVSSPINGSVDNLKSYGYFERGGSNFPFDNGIVLTTGEAKRAGNDEVTFHLSDGNGNKWGGDEDLANFLDVDKLSNATVFEFNFTPPTNHIAFRYILASEEYIGVFPCSYSDGFAFLIKETGSNQPFKNIALVPGTQTPVNTTTIRPNIEGLNGCDAKNDGYYESNKNNLGNTNYNGRTKILTASANVIAHKTYTIKLAIADQKDDNYDSAVFIEGNSFVPSINLGNDVSSCDSHYEIDADVENPNATYQWYRNNTLLPSETAPSIVATQSGTYKVDIAIQSGNSNCVISDTINLDLYVNSQSYAITDMTICDNSTNNGIETFNLATKQSEIIEKAGQQLNISFYKTLNDANTNTNALPLNYTNTQNPEQIFIKIGTNNGCSSIENFELRVIPSPEIEVPQPLVMCDTNYDGSVNFDLTSVQPQIYSAAPSDIEIAYYTSIANAENSNSPITDLENYNNTSNPQTIYIRARHRETHCFTIVPLHLIVNLPPEVNSSKELQICLEDASTISLESLDTMIANVSDTSSLHFSYYTNATDAQNTSNPLSKDTINSSTITDVHVRVENTQTGCVTYNDYILLISEQPKIQQPNDLVTCDDEANDGYEMFNLEMTKTDILGALNPSDFSVTYHLNETMAHNNENALSVNYVGQNNQPIYARVENTTTGCYSLVYFYLYVLRKPQVTIPDQVVCINNLPLVVSADTGVSEDSYLWSNGATTSEIEITEFGSYTVSVVSEMGCVTEETFIVTESEAAQIEVIETVDFSDANNITITVRGMGNYFYQLDNGMPQESNIFENVSLGYHDLKVIDMDGCGEVTKEVLVIDYPKFITPNNDGTCDTWHIAGVETLPGTKIAIFDRYGKTVAKLTSNCSGWDGTYQGNPLPTNDYWFVADVMYDNTEFQVKGHFTLKR